MKSLFSSAQRCNRKFIALHSVWYVIIAVTILFTGCKKENLKADMERHNLMSNSESAQASFFNKYTGLSRQTLWELQQVRAATAKYKNIENAIKDEYVDIAVDVQNMGHHYMKRALLDGTFDLKQPEILVYNRNERGVQELVAVEYAVPLTYAMPEGFTGEVDVWNGNAGFGLWLLHAWVWKYNPAGVFNPTNSEVHLN